MTILKFIKQATALQQLSLAAPMDEVDLEYVQWVKWWRSATSWRTRCAS
jgi:hypothetical protein